MHTLTIHAYGLSLVCCVFSLCSLLPIFFLFLHFFMKMHQVHFCAPFCALGRRNGRRISAPLISAIRGSRQGHRNMDSVARFFVRPFLRPRPQNKGAEFPLTCVDWNSAPHFCDQGRRNKGADFDLTCNFSKTTILQLVTL